MTSVSPPWYPVAKIRPEPVLRVQNTLTKSKVEFIPQDGKLVKWYNCGPTVYDHAHLGHARNYVSQDVIRRILTDYFNYDVQFVMNITDIEDKIIQASRKKYLFSQFLSENPIVDESLLSLIRTKWIAYFRKTLAPYLAPKDYPSEDEILDTTWSSLSSQFLLDKNFRMVCLQKSEKFEMNFNQLNNTYNAIEKSKAMLNSQPNSQIQSEELVNAAYDVLTYSLDEELRHTVAPVIQQLCKEHSAFWEKQFMLDMKALRVQPPSLLTRVTEYVPEIVDFIREIVRRGFGYEQNGSVYFDTQAFDGALNRSETGTGGEQLMHWYLKLEPWSRGNKERVDEAEGALVDKQSAKRSNADFVLWKASKPGEPSWPSLWGPGRPGWHIECSVMASAVFGSNMDIHSGGEDLAFPHHDNELAQSEAHHDCKQWVNYFIHTGHLHIEGLKMSKSLKNFITIQDILKKYTARQLRLSFISQLWSSKMDFQESLMSGEVKSWEATFNNFFSTTRALMNQVSGEGDRLLDESAVHGYNLQEKELSKFLLDSQYDFRVALCDSFNTPQALDVLLRLVSKTNIYINSRKSLEVNHQVVYNVAIWVTKMLRMLGLGEGPDTGGIGWGDMASPESASVSSDREQLLMPYLKALSSFRDNIRTLAMKKDVSQKEFLTLCDHLRDEGLVPLGVALNDQEDGPALIKFVPPEMLMEARDAKRRLQEEKAEKKNATLVARLEKERQQMERGKMDPTEMFKTGDAAKEYSSWDENGIPLKLADGSDLSKKAIKKIRSKWEQQLKRHQDYLNWEQTRTE